MKDDLYERAAKNWDAVNAEIFKNLVCYVYNIPYVVLFGGVKMKAKYNRMVDEYVKKHYGDLDRGVLSDEVKYKVLFKIYRKKYKKEKMLAETLSRMLTRKDNTHNWSAEFDHLVKEYKNLTPKHEDEVLPLCDTCKYQNKDGKFCAQDLMQNKETDCNEYKHYMIP